MNNSISLILMGALVGLSACTNDDLGDRGDSVEFRGASGSDGYDTSAGDPTLDPSGPVTGQAGPVTVQARLLTAGVWDDNDNYEFFTSYHKANRSVSGLPGLEIEARTIIHVVDSVGNPVANARVMIPDGNYQTMTGTDGRALWFRAPRGEDAQRNWSLAVTSAAGDASVNVGGRPAEISIRMPGTAPLVRKLDVVLMIDATGSMGDEINYLFAEVGHIATEVSERHVGVQQRWGLVAYKDVGDEYVARPMDFTSSVEDFRVSLSRLDPGGGGDLPEAPDRALAELNNFHWSHDAARVVFWIADAPHHAQNADAMKKGIENLVAKGVHVYPIAASGVDALAEISMRAAALVTGGRYLFLTDDSGIGNAHKEPQIPCYYVTTLQSAMARVIDGELTGHHVGPEAKDVLRSSGSPDSTGSCLLANDQEAFAF